MWRSFMCVSLVCGLALDSNTIRSSREMAGQSSELLVRTRRICLKSSSFLISLGLGLSLFLSPSASWKPGPVSIRSTKRSRPGEQRWTKHTALRASTQTVQTMSVEGRSGHRWGDRSCYLVDSRLEFRLETKSSFLFC